MDLNFYRSYQASYSLLLIIVSLVLLFKLLQVKFCMTSLCGGCQSNVGLTCRVFPEKYFVCCKNILCTEVHRCISIIGFGNFNKKTIDSGAWTAEDIQSITLTHCSHKGQIIGQISVPFIIAHEIYSSLFGSRNDAAGILQAFNCRHSVSSMVHESI